MSEKLRYAVKFTRRSDDGETWRPWGDPFWSHDTALGLHEPKQTRHGWTQDFISAAEVTAPEGFDKQCPRRWRGGR